MATNNTGPRQEPFDPTWALIQKPANYPEFPTYGKIEAIYSTNSKSLYRRLSPYANYNQGLLSWGTQPFFWIYPDEGGKGLPALRKYESRLFPMGSAPMDIIRVTKFMVSGAGIGFMAKQFLLQTGNPYNERRIYNPLSPVIAASMTLTLGAMRPERSFDTSAGLAGIATSVLGSVGSAIFGPPKTNPVPGTTLVNNAESLPTVNIATGTKGLIRAGTAERAKAHLDAAWQGGKNPKFSVLGLIKSLFQNFIPQTQPGMQYRSDEGAYGIMITAGSPRFNYNGSNGASFTFGQLWYAGGKIMRKKDVKVIKPTRMYVTYNAQGVCTVENKDMTSGNVKQSYILRGAVGYIPTQSRNENKPGQRYSDAIGILIPNAGNGYESSDIVYQYSYYMDVAQAFPTKEPDKNKDDSSRLNAALKKVVENFKNISSGIYTVDASADNELMRSGTGQYNYNRILNTNRQGVSAKNLPKGALSSYRASGVRMVDVNLGTDAKNSYKLPTNGTFDAINTLEVLSNDKKINNSKLAGWTEWEPYKDDLIAFFFYDVVNKKYIPFRCTVKGLTENSNAVWEELSFVGRPDRVYSYGGFTRNASFSIKIVIGSPLEFAPTWQRINYICTSCKPSNYTKSTYNNVTDRFMVPPMFLVTIGDFYRDQPILIQSLALTVPEDAAWETLNEDNTGVDWNYLAGIIKSPKVLFGQFPREIELNFTVALLEKERAMVGGANFGHAPRNEDLTNWSAKAIRTDSNNTKTRHYNKMSKNLVVNSKVYDYYDTPPNDAENPPIT